jgi:hypothetical protein
MTNKNRLCYVCLDTNTDELIVCTNKIALSKYIGVHRNTIRSIINTNKKVILYKQYKIWNQIIIQQKR